MLFKCGLKLMTSVCQEQNVISWLWILCSKGWVPKLGCSFCIVILILLWMVSSWRLLENDDNCIPRIWGVGLELFALSTWFFVQKTIPLLVWPFLTSTLQCGLEFMVGTCKNFEGLGLDYVHLRLDSQICCHFNIRELLKPSRLLLMPPRSWFAVMWFWILRVMSEYLKLK